MSGRREFTHYQGDVMTATTQSSVAGEPPRISRMTLALMEDTGVSAALAVLRHNGLTQGQVMCQGKDSRFHNLMFHSPHKVQTPDFRPQVQAGRYAQVSYQ